MLLSKIYESFIKNSRGFFRSFRFFIILTILACLFDMASTIYFMVQGGYELEMHPGIRIVSMVLGPIAGPIIGKFLQFCAVIIITILFRPYAKYIFILVIALYIWAAWYNVWGYQIYLPRFMKYLPI